MADQFNRLPAEILFMILSYLPISALIAFGATCKPNNEIHKKCMGKLHLAVFHKHIHATVALLGTGTQHDLEAENHRVRVILPPATRYKNPRLCKLPSRISNRYSSEVKCSESKYTLRKSCRRLHSEDEGFVRSISTDRTIRAQNDVLADVLSQHGNSLHELDFLAYDINEDGAMAIGTSCGSRLRHLALRFEHSFVKDVSLPHGYWTTPARGSTAWNNLIEIGPVKRGLDIVNLETLILERAGITPWQLRMLVTRNNRLKVLKLRTCAGVQPEFFNWLGGIIDQDAAGNENNETRKVPGALLAVLWMENCDGIRASKSVYNTSLHRIDTGLEWIRNLKSLKSLSLRECRNVDSKIVDKANKLLWHIPELYLPRSVGTDYELPPPIEVDPLYL